MALRTLALAGATAVAAAGFAGCGQKGPLVLPPSKAAPAGAAAAASSPAPAPSR